MILFYLVALGNGLFSVLFNSMNIIGISYTIYLTPYSTNPEVQGRRTYRPIEFTGLTLEMAVESADSTAESANYTTDSVIVAPIKHA